MDVLFPWLIILFLVLGLILAYSWIKRLHKANGLLKSREKSIFTKHGQMAEQFLPFSRKFPGNPQDFRFLGSPVDGVCFDDDRVLIVEFKTGKSRLSDRQKHIRDLVRSGKVYFQEVRL